MEYDLLKVKPMKKILVICLACLSLAAQAQTFLWPMAGKKAGEDILAQPQGFIGDELSYGELFIGGKAGDVVICPVDGTIISLGVNYQVKLDAVICEGLNPALTLDENIAATDFGKDTNPRYRSVAIGIRLADGRKLYLGGLAGKTKFKTGQKLAAGDTLGVLGYSYKALKAPSLMLSVSNVKGQNIDPMAPFGIKSTFVETSALVREDPAPAAKVQEDLELLKNAICQLYPSLEQHMPKEKFVAYIDSLKQSVTGPVDVTMDFRLMLREILHKLPDSHLNLYRDPVKTDLGPVWRPSEFLIVCDDTVRVLSAGQGYESLSGKIVTKIDGRPAIEYARRAENFVNDYDSGVQSFVQEDNVMLSYYGVLLSPHATKGTVHKLEFADGTSATVPFSQQPKIRSNEAWFKLVNWLRINQMRSQDDVFETRTLNDSTAYLAIKTFEMLDAQVEAIGDYLSKCKAKNLIVDVRNNVGGRNDVLMKILSYFADAPMARQRGGFNRVIIKGKQPILGQTQNFNADIEMFRDYEDRGDGFYYLTDSVETCASVTPDPKVHYGGKVYVLTNGHSISAATLFPSILVRNRRAVSVGRETGSAYHFMTALKFAELRLPNTLQSVRIPLVQLVFDTTVCDRLPWGRGLMPDYPLPLTFKEIMGGRDGKTDVMLNYALSLIAQGKYLSAKDPFKWTNL